MKNDHERIPGWVFLDDKSCRPHVSPGVANHRVPGRSPDRMDSVNAPPARLFYFLSHWIVLLFRQNAILLTEVDLDFPINFQLQFVLGAIDEPIDYPKESRTLWYN